MDHPLLFNRLLTRLALDKDDGDHAYFNSLTLTLEYLTKVITSGIVACLGDDSEQQRYSLEYKLIRADSIGAWVTCLHEALVGPPSQLVRDGAQPFFRELTQKVREDDWRMQAVVAMKRAAASVGVNGFAIGHTVALRQLFDIWVALRNRSRGHGATTTDQCSASCKHLRIVCDLLRSNLKLFDTPWAFLHRNLSGKYRVSMLLGTSKCFDHLKTTRSVHLPNGVYIFVNGPVHIPLVYSDPNVNDIFVPNGAHRNGTFETLSYITNETIRQNSSEWQHPPGRLPASETEGRQSLDVVGNTFSNVPHMPPGYIARPGLQSQVSKELQTRDRHRIVSLTGPGGIGKTTISIASITELATQEEPPYGAILWISARDVDLLDSGPRRVAARAVTQRDIARAAVNLLGPSEAKQRSFDPIGYFQTCLSDAPDDDPTLFVFDNFETVENPSDVYNWLETHIRLPNKVLITTRVRSFRGDYHIDIGGMTDDEANELIERHAARLGVGSLVTKEYRRELIEESGGHPYVIKILLGDVAREGKRAKPKRVMASSSELLRALFERTYISLSPGAQRVFLLLCSWRVSVPEIGVEAVVLRPDSERFDVARAFEELSRYSLIERVGADGDEAFVTVSLSAGEFGKRKLVVSPWRRAVEKDLQLLREFGVGRRREGDDATYGVYPRIDNLVRSVAREASEDVDALGRAMPILEYLAARVPRAYTRLAELVMEVDGNVHAERQAKEYLERFVEYCAREERLGGWLRLARLCEDTADVHGEIRALCEAGIATGHDQDGLKYVVRRVNRRLWEMKRSGIEEVRSLRVTEVVEMLAEDMERRRNGLTSVNCSGLAWLHLNIGGHQAIRKARNIADLGLSKDPGNEHCLRILDRLQD